jgi:hypothetical protein
LRTAKASSGVTTAETPKARFGAPRPAYEYPLWPPQAKALAAPPSETAATARTRRRRRVLGICEWAALLLAGIGRAAEVERPSFE